MPREHGWRWRFKSCI
ncbi:hypothetical protein EC880221_4212, partial [Escherichia coli 88.0221]